MIQNNSQVESKLTPEHLKRDAYLYIRQSTLKQVMQNTESTRRQYDLKERALAMGFSNDQIVTIDRDQGQSGSSSEGREGFKEMVSEVGMGNVGLVIGLEVSRLARNNSDWHRLLEICALTGTLILDEDGLYNPADFNDRLVLGLKGTMSEAELHILKSRLRGGVLGKASRGELKLPLPIGFVYNDLGKVILDPDEQIQSYIYLLFKTFRREGSARATVKYFVKNQMKFPRRFRRGPWNGKVVWKEFDSPLCLSILHNPRYCGVFFYGRTHSRLLPDGNRKSEKLDRQKWYSLIKDSHQGYISWEEYEENQRLLSQNAQRSGSKNRLGVAREGRALLQGLLICGYCGRRMIVHYRGISGQIKVQYSCRSENNVSGGCQSISGTAIDQAVGDLLIKTVKPFALELALNIREELRLRHEEVDLIRKQRVKQSQYEVDLARRRYMNVDPQNRLVASTLEVDWEEKFKQFRQAQQDYERQRDKDRTVLDSQIREEIMSLSGNFEQLWNDPGTSWRDKKRMVRLLIEDATIKKQDKEVLLHFRFKGGAAHSESIPLPKTGFEKIKTKAEVVRQIESLLHHHSESEIAGILNQRGEVSGTGKRFNKRIVYAIIWKHGFKRYYDYLRERGMLELSGISRLIELSTETITAWEKKGLLKSHRYNDSNKRLYERPGMELIKILKEGKILKKSSTFIQNLEARLTGGAV
jgi:DNA invertase Pin-like site-specific DNA recombinase